MNVEILADAAAVGRRGAAVIAEAARAAIKDRGRFVVAVSGGHTPWLMLEAFAREELPWDAVHVVQVDERVAPADSDDRNLKHLRASLAGAPLPSENIHPMPVEDADLVAAAGRYARSLEDLAGGPPELDLVHLGLGPDGHTASLVPGDPVLDVADRSVALAGPYQDRERMTLTYPVLDNAKTILWVVTGENKVDALRRLVAADSSIPAGRVRARQATLLVDAAAAPGVDA